MLKLRISAQLNPNMQITINLPPSEGLPAEEILKLVRAAAKLNITPEQLASQAIMEKVESLSQKEEVQA